MTLFQFPYNEQLIWDYDLPPDAQENESFQRWYLARVLMRGSSADLCQIGLSTIYAFLPVLQLPLVIRSFWDWYFELPHVKSRYEHINRFSEDTIATHRQ